jgi:acyl carrier protein
MTVDDVRGIVGEAARRDVSGLGPDEDLVLALGLDSLEGLRVLALVEKRFGVRFDDARLASLRSLRTISHEVEALRAGRGS